MTTVTDVSGPATVAPTAPADASSAPAPAAPTTTLPDPLTAMSMGDDMIAQVVALMAKSFRQDRADARKLNRIAESNIAKETAEKIKAMHEKADQIRKEGLVAGITMMAGGALTATGAAMSMFKVGQSTTTTTQSGQYLHRNGMTSEWSRTVQSTSTPAWTELGSGGGKIVEGSGSLAASTHRAAQTEADGEAAKRDANAEAAKRRADEYRGEEDDARRMLDKVAEFLKSVRDSQNASNQAALRRA
ncbi:MAG: hypothetical protein R3B13_32995 [Polyangiaceae bacterium]